ncbi:MAG: glycine oxidase ThiO, partial [Candidatus Latescibacteria bacterium]|nr:glycine oxidase ThiO [Candidatus Latescibacterota bacterium]
VIIIGGGVIGLSIAYALAAECKSIKVLEASEPGRGASWASAGVLAPQGAQPRAGPYLDLSLQSLGLFDEFAAGLLESSGMDIEYRNEGGLHVAFDDEDAQALLERYDHQCGLGLPVQKLDRNEVLELEPILGPELRSGLLFEGMHQVDNRKMVEALRVAVGLRGTEIVSGAPATGLMVGKNRIGGVETPRGAFRAGIVINAAGAWSRTIGGDQVPSPPVKPVKGQMLSLDVGDTTPIGRVIHGISQYLVPRRDGRLLVGATVEKVGFDGRVTAGGISVLLKTALRMAPGLERASITETWSGMRPMSKDGKPIIGPTNVQGYLMATGHFRNGILLAPVTAQLIQQYIVSGKVPSEMAPFLLERFSGHS